MALGEGRAGGGVSNAHPWPVVLGREVLPLLPTASSPHLLGQELGTC